MGNTIVIPSFKDWYNEPLKKNGYVLSNHIDSGTFFMVFEGKDEMDEEVIIKAYEYNNNLSSIPHISQSFHYVDLLINNINDTNGIIPYSKVIVNGSIAFLIRNKMNQSLSEYIQSQQPPLHETEKIWISFQIIRSLMSLWFLKLYHGDLKPNNVFVTHYNQVFLADVAPFKPKRIRKQMPQLFYHYFTTPSSSNCYLAPERLSDPCYDDYNAEFMINSDLFSLGCLITYIFTDGKDLFDFSTLVQYSNGLYDIEPTIQGIPNKKIQDLLRILLSLDPMVRKEAISVMDSFFPTNLPDLYIYASSIYQKNNPVSSYNIFCTLKEASFFSEELRVIFHNILDEHLLKIYDSKELMDCIEFYADFSINLETDIKEIRCLSTLSTFLDNQSSLILTTTFRAILKICKSIDKASPLLSSIFRSTVLVKVQTISYSTSWTNRIIIADFIPKFCLQIHRLAPDCLERIPVLSQFLSMSTETSVFQAFAKSYSLVISEGGYNLFSAFYQFFLTLLNHQSMEYVTGVFDLLMISVIKRKPSEMPLFRELFVSSISTIILDILFRSQNEKTIFFVSWLLKNRLIHESFFMEIYKHLIPYSHSLNPELQYSASLALKNLPSYSSIWFDSFILHKSRPKSMNRSRRYTEIRSYDNNGQLFDSKKVVNVKPFFLSSFQKKCSVIDHIVDISKGSSFVTVDRSNIIRWMGMPTHDNPCMHDTFSKTSRKPVSSVLSLPNQSLLAIGHDDGSISSYDLNTGRKGLFSYSHLHSDRIVWMNKHSDSCFLAITQSGMVFLNDIRTEQPQLTNQFQNGNVLSSSNWFSDISVIGFDSGTIAIFDMRTFMPIILQLTISPKQIIPVAFSKCSLAITDGHQISVHCCDKNKQIINIESEASQIIPADPGFLYVNNNTTGLVSVDNPNKSIVLFDDFLFENIPYTLTKKGLSVLSPKSIKGKSLHNHVDTITAATRLGDNYITGDKLGFVNLWTISKSSLT